MRGDMSDRELEIVLFDAFCEALRRLCHDDYRLFSSQKRKGPITHRIAMYIEAILDRSSMICDTQFQIRGDRCTYTPDIVVHDRQGGEVMALYWQDGYLSAQEKAEARDFHREKKCLTLAFSLLPEKDYFLIYRFAGSYTDYLHLSREDFSEDVLKRCSNDEDIFDDQMTLSLTRRRTRKRPSAAEDPSLSE